MNNIITIRGNPIPLARPRFGKGHVYDSQKVEKLWYQCEMRRQTKLWCDFPLRMELIFEFPMVGIPKCRQSLYLGKPHMKRPDLSNLVKFVEDAALGVLYSDDSLIVEIMAIKRYAIEGKTTIVLTESAW